MCKKATSGLNDTHMTKDIELRVGLGKLSSSELLTVLRSTAAAWLEPWGSRRAGKQPLHVKLHNYHQCISPLQHDDQMQGDFHIGRALPTFSTDGPCKCFPLDMFPNLSCFVYSSHSFSLASHVRQFLRPASRATSRILRDTFVQSQGHLT